MAHRQKSEGGLTRREILKYGFYTSLAAGLQGSFFLGGCRREKANKEPVNIILISLDTLRADRLGCYGYHRSTSPVLDNLASRSLVFENFMATSPWTLPSHGSMLTGLYPSRHGMRTYKNRLLSGVKTLTDVLKEHGFSTAAVVNSMYLIPKYGFDKGFDDFIYVKEDFAQREPSEVGQVALRLLGQKRPRPFFLFLHYYDLHSDYCSLGEYEKQFVRPYDGIADGTTAQLVNFYAGEVSFDQAAAQHLNDLYDASIRQLDDMLGNLFAYLEKEKLIDETLLIVTSDHGEEFMDHGGVLHGRTQFEELLHIPLIMRGPGIPESKRLKELASLVDIMPTILSYAGIAGIDSLEGINLCPLWQERDYKLPRRYLFSEASELITPQRDLRYDIVRAVRHPRYKLIHNKLTDEANLYDLHNDPKETTDVAGEHASLAQSMMAQLQSFMETDRTGNEVPPLTPEEIQKLKGLGYL